MNLKNSRNNITMKDKLEKYLLIGVGVLVVGYLLWKKYKPKKCVKWTQNVCATAPCNQTCVEYK